MQLLVWINIESHTKLVLKPAPAMHYRLLLYWKKRITKLCGRYHLINRNNTAKNNYLKLYDFN